MTLVIVAGGPDPWSAPLSDTADIAPGPRTHAHCCQCRRCCLLIHGAGPHVQPPYGTRGTRADQLSRSFGQSVFGPPPTFCNRPSFFGQRRLVVKVDRMIRWHYTTTRLYFAFALVHDSRGIEIVNFTVSLALSAGTLMASAGTPGTA